MSSTTRNGPNIELHVEELVLTGFSPSAPDRLAAAMRTELERLFARGGAAAEFEKDSTIAQLDAGQFYVRRGSPAVETGAQIAQHIHSALQEAYAGNGLRPAEVTGRYQAGDHA